jgi:AraC-like DNA-binding protein
VWVNDALREKPQRVVPDGCVDLVWFDEDGLMVVGADTGPRHVDPVGSAVSGIRLRPGSAGAVLGIPASEVCDLQVEASAVWGSHGARLAELLTTADPSRRLGVLSDAVSRRGASSDPLVAAAARRLSRPSARVTDVAADLGLSERQLRRRTMLAVGYGPKTLARVARLRRLVALDGHDLAVRAVLAGYASQAHMSEEVRRLTGTTPVRFLKDATLTAA